MFESLRQAFREAVDNFRTELRRDEVPEAADRLLRAMEREVARVRADLKRLEEDKERTDTEAAREEGEVATCLRREELARRIGDEETAEIARRFARRHLRRRDLLQEKSRLLEREIAEAHQEGEAMLERLREARLQRDALTAATGRTEARQRLQEADDLFDALDRMAERIDDLEARGRATEEVERALAETPPPGDPPPAPGDAASRRGGAGSTRETAGSPHPPDDLDLRLAALKRKMGLDP